MFYGFGFLSILFLGFFSGYLFAIKILNFSFENSLIFSIFSGTIMLFVETFLLIFRIQKID
jgi:hypothetical protein